MHRARTACTTDGELNFELYKKIQKENATTDLKRKWLMQQDNKHVFYTREWSQKNAVNV